MVLKYNVINIMKISIKLLFGNKTEEYHALSYVRDIITLQLYSTLQFVSAGISRKFKLVFREI